MRLTAALLAVIGTMAIAAAQNDSGGGLAMRVVSTDPALVTGGDALVELTVPADVNRGAISVRAVGRDVTSAFLPGTRANTLVGLVTGLPNGPSTIEAAAGSRRAVLAVTNYPITGPVISGPPQQPYICQTEQFVLPDGSKLGPARDANCSARTVVQHVYLPTGAPADAERAFKPLPANAPLPADVATTTTSAGATVNFIVRVETGTMNRGIYQNAVLHDPTIDPEPTPAAPPRGWNHHLVGFHGSGCASGWYIQGAAMGVSVLDRSRLGKGDAIFVNTLNHPTNSCNAFLAGETTMMGKEHFIETFGPPDYTLTTGGSGGAYTSLQVADAFPGLFDAADIRATFPDALAIAMSGTDARLLLHYFGVTRPGSFTEAEQVAVSGYHGFKAFLDAANQSQRTDPVANRADLEGYQSARFNAAVPATLRYDPVTNPHGARPTVFDAARNIYGVDPATGAALRPYDNTGVQYGLAALNAHTITASQFLDLNERIGGFDSDANYTAARSVGSAAAIRRVYESDLMLSGGGGLRSIPILDNATSREDGGYHYGWFHFALRDRLRQANGDSANMVMWRSVSGTKGQELLDRWMAAIKADTSNADARTRMLRAKPADAVDGCFDKSEPPQFVADSLPFTSAPTSKCSEMYPVYSNPRKEAGGPLAANVLKCQVKPIDAKDYAVTFTPEQWSRLKAIFPGGVCDWSKPGVNQVPLVTWASFGPSPQHLIFDVTRPRDSSR